MKHSPNPSLSVVIPTYRRLPLLRRLLEALTQGAPPERVEIIVVNNDVSDTQFASHLSDLVRKGTFSVQVVTERKRGQSHARNKGAALATYEYLVFIDDDIRFEAGADPWKQLFSLIKGNRQAAVIGVRVLSEYLGQQQRRYNLIHKYAAWVLGECDSGMTRFEVTKMSHYICSALFIFRRDIFNQLKFGTQLGGMVGTRLIVGEDGEIQKRLLARGLGTIIYDPSVTIYNTIDESRLGLRYVFGRYFDLGIERRMMGENELPFQWPDFVWLMRIASLSEGPFVLFIFFSHLVADAQFDLYSIKNSLNQRKS